MIRKILWLFAILLFAHVQLAETQQPANIPRIAVLLSGSSNPFWVDAFRKALRELGYIEGKISLSNTATPRVKATVNAACEETSRDESRRFGRGWRQ
jgi:ABC-type sugar transport system substrate-binding protein